MIFLTKIAVLTSWFASMAGTVIAAADTACAESGLDFRDGAHVLNVVLSRMKKPDWARYRGKSKLEALFVKYQHAHGCKIGLRYNHLILGLQYVTDSLQVEPWARNALFYCGNYDRPGQCESYATGNTAMVYLGRIAHSYWGVQKRK